MRQQIPSLSRWGQRSRSRCHQYALSARAMPQNWACRCPRSPPTPGISRYLLNCTSGADFEHNQTSLPNRGFVRVNCPHLSRRRPDQTMCYDNHKLLGFLHYCQEVSFVRLSVSRHRQLGQALISPADNGADPPFLLANVLCGALVNESPTTTSTSTPGWYCVLIPDLQDKPGRWIVAVPGFKEIQSQMGLDSNSTLAIATLLKFPTRRWSLLCSSLYRSKLADRA
ncbi:hypothetical protein J6590_099530 [Homalodisca vitripennis]|nr:hypothetical protein J6590_099530 [Homalodisca vitripennis]